MASEMILCYEITGTTGFRTPYLNADSYVIETGDAQPLKTPIGAQHASVALRGCTARIPELQRRARRRGGPRLLEMSVFGALQPVADGTPASTG
jgi:hypothetical protein